MNFLPHVDALNIDLKGFSNEFYRYVKGEFDTVKEFIKAAVEHKCHVELTTLVIPTKNDDPEEMEREVEWIASISPEIPLHLSRFSRDIRPMICRLLLLKPSIG